jgi:hypothetical protein
MTIASDVRKIGKHLSRTRYQRGSLRTTVPAHGGRPERKLPRGCYWSSWYAYVRLPDGKEVRRKREKIIDRDVAERHRIALAHAGPLNKADAQRLLDLLIAADTRKCAPPGSDATLGEVATQYLELARPNWGAHMWRAAGNLVEKHTITGAIGERTIADLSEPDIQAWLNSYVGRGSSRSLLKALLLHVRAIFKLAAEEKANDGDACRFAGEEQSPCLRALPLDRRVPPPARPVQRTRSPHCAACDTARPETGGVVRIAPRRRAR